MMENPFAGEVVIRLDGQAHVCKLTLGALVGLETALGTESLFDLIERMETQKFAISDLYKVLFAGLRGGGWQGSEADLLTAQIEGGPLAAAKSAAALLVRAFQTPDAA